MYKNNQGHLTVFCIVFVWLRGPPSPVRIMTQVPWFMYQNRIGPSDGIYHPNFAPCFVVLYLNCWNSTEILLRVYWDFTEIPLKSPKETPPFNIKLKKSYVFSLVSFHFLGQNPLRAMQHLCSVSTNQTKNLLPLVFSLLASDICYTNHPSLYNPVQCNGLK